MQAIQALISFAEIKKTMRIDLKENIVGHSSPRII